MNVSAELPPATDAADAASVLPAKGRPVSPAFWRNPWLWIAFALIGFCFWQWQETRVKLGQTQAALAGRLASIDEKLQAADTAQTQNQSGLAAQGRRLDTVESGLSRLEDEAASVRALYQEAADSRNEALLLEIEQSLTLAQQQLQIADNAAGAIAALQSADDRLARLPSPRFLPLRRAIAHDLQALRTSPFADIPDLSRKLEVALSAIDHRPTRFATPLPATAAVAPPDGAPVAASSAAPADAGQWALLSAFWQEIKQIFGSLVRVRRLDNPEATLPLDARQAEALRQSIVLRLLNARLALLLRDAPTYRLEIAAVRKALERHFAPEAVKPVDALLAQLAAAPVGQPLPALTESLVALEAIQNRADAVTAEAEGGHAANGAP
jgi:uroporphyrin-3 C-methyltransferase